MVKELYILLQSSIFTLMSSVLTAQQPVSNTSKDAAVSKAQEYIDAFRRGEDFQSPATDVFVAGQPDGAALKLLGKELAVASPAVREQIVALLVDMGVSTDPLQSKGAEVLRNAQIIALLAGVGLAAPDLGREAAMDALRKLTRQSDLAPFGDAFIAALKQSPSEMAFLLVAKAKPQNAKALVDPLALSPPWQDVEAAKIARAALGAKDVEDEFLARVKKAEAAKDGKALSEALGSLALVGTPRSLKAIAERLRTPLTIHMVGAFERSVRLNVLEALLYNYPDQPVFSPNNINDEADYTAAERFCTWTLGVKYTKPPPPFLTVRGYPIPMRQP
jgi:hypothetical protein